MSDLEITKELKQHIEKNYFNTSSKITKNKITDIVQEICNELLSIDIYSLNELFAKYGFARSVNRRSMHYVRKPSNIIPVIKEIFNEKIKFYEIQTNDSNNIITSNVNFVNLYKKNYYNSQSGYHTYKPNILLDQSYETIDVVNGLKTSLFPHQRTALKAMFDLENNKEIQFENWSLEYCASVLSEPVGSGKTILSLALILLQKIPKAVPMIYSTSDRDNSISSRRVFDKILLPTLVFVGRSVINQWIDAVKRFTNLRLFVVNNVIDLRILISKIISGVINDYDIIIVKNGNITVDFNFPTGITKENINNKTAASIYNIIANLRDYCWARVIIDDFDTIGLPKNFSIISALFTWYISSTRKSAGYCRYNITNENNVETPLEYWQQPISQINRIISNSTLYEILNVRNCKNYIKETNKMSNPEFYVYVYNNPNNRLVGLIGNMSEENKQIMEMLNSDAIETAAEQAGVKTTSVADIFQKLLGDNFKMYEFSNKLLTFINDTKPILDVLEPRPEDSELRYGKKRLLKFETPEYKYTGIKPLFEDTEVEYKEKNVKSSLAINRVKDNVKSGNCTYCQSELDDEDEATVILSCCTTTVCGSCCQYELGFSKFGYGTCHNCRRRLNFKDIIYLDGSFDLEAIVSGKMEYVEEETGPGEEEPEGPAEPRIASKNTALLEIIRGEVPLERKRVDININNLMKGNHQLPEEKVKKVLIFTNYDETIRNTCKLLDDEKIKYERLIGSAGHISKLALDFHDSKEPMVLVINSTTHCSGLNLQAATDLVFMHKILNKHIETQVVGRIQRLGRTSTAKIHYLLYENEYQLMMNYSIIREVSQEEAEGHYVVQNYDNVAIR